MNTRTALVVHALLYFLIARPASAESWMPLPPSEGYTHDKQREIDFDSIKRVGKSVIYMARINKIEEPMIGDCDSKTLGWRMEIESEIVKSPVRKNSQQEHELLTVCELLSKQNQRAESQNAVSALQGLGPTADPTISCLKNIALDEKLEVISSKFALDATQTPSLEILASKSRANAKERNALSIFSAESERCYALGDGWRNKNYPSQINTILLDYRVDDLTKVANLYSGFTTFGEIGKSRLKAAIEFKVRLNSAVDTIKIQEKEAERQRQDEIFRRSEAESRESQQRSEAENQAQIQRQALARQSESIERQEKLMREMVQAQREQSLVQTLQNLSRQFQPPPPPPMPTTTNCRSVVFGNVVRTQCY